MRRAKYSAKQVSLPLASLIGYGTRVAKPGHWVVWASLDGRTHVGRVLGRIDEVENDGLENCKGFLAVMRLNENMSHAFVNWVNPRDVTLCIDKPPKALLTWITGDDWPMRAADIPRLIAMSEHGTCSEDYIDSRNDRQKPYNCRPEYVEQFILI